MKSLSFVQRAMITEVVQISANLQNSPLQSATASTGGRSFSMPHRVGTWLPVKMTQQIIPLGTHIFIASIVPLATFKIATI